MTSTIPPIQAETTIRPSGSGRLSPYWVVSDILTITWRNMLRYVRLPQLLVFSTIQPVMFLLLFNFVFGGAIPVGEIDYTTYLLPGIFAQVVLFGSVQTGVGLAEDLSRGMIDRFRSLPMARSAVLAGRTLSDVVRNAFVVLLMTGVGYLLGFRFQGGFLAALGAIGLILLLGLAFSWLSAFVGLTVKDTETAQAAGFLFVFPFIFASSAFVPVETMPGWLQVFVRWQPVTNIIDAVRALTLGGLPGRDTTTEVLQALAWVAVMLLVFVPLSVRRYRRRT